MITDDTDDDDADSRPMRFERGPGAMLALEARAVGELFPSAMRTSDLNIADGGIAVVSIDGPLAESADPWFDCYPSITARVAAAAANPSVRAVVLAISSPGGDLGGCLQCARSIRACCVAADKPLFAAASRACSAACALASAATHGVIIEETGSAGSLGVLAQRLDLSEQNAQRGVRVAFVASGRRKADGIPDRRVSAAEIEATQAQVDQLARSLFDVVAAHRPQLTAEQIAALDGGVFFGSRAVDVGLADGVGTLDDVIEAARRDANFAASSIYEQPAPASAYQRARVALTQAAKGRDPNARAARRALAKLTAHGTPAAAQRQTAAAPTTTTTRTTRITAEASMTFVDDTARKAPAKTETIGDMLDRLMKPWLQPQASSKVTRTKDSITVSVLGDMPKQERARRSAPPPSPSNTRGALARRPPPITTVSSTRSARDASAPLTEAQHMNLQMGITVPKPGTTIRRDPGGISFSPFNLDC